MGVTRIVANLTVADTAAANRFYADVFDLTIADDFGWVGFLVGPHPAAVELHTVTHDETAPVDPVVSIGVDDVDACYERVRAAGARIVHPLTDEQWGVRRFFFTDPDGNVINVVGHR